MDFAFHAPFNSLSLGQVSINVAKEFHKRGLEPCIFSIGDDNFTAFKLSDDFKLWFKSCKDKALKIYKREWPTIRIWHITESQHQVTNKQILCTFHECDQLTETESNIIRNNYKVLFSSKYSTDIAKTFGAENVDNFPLAFDSDSFFNTERKYLDSGVMQFGLAGKVEKRKNHIRIINLWVKKYGNNPKYSLNLAIYNPFLPPEVQQNMLIAATEGKQYFNINVLPFMEGNDAYNDYLNSNSAMIDLSSAEGWSLPSFQSACLGKHVLALNATGMKDWVNEENSVIVKPTGKIPLYDGVFFREGLEFNQGSGFDWKDEQFYEGMDKLIKRIEENPINEAGTKLKEQFTYEKTVDKILFELDQSIQVMPTIP